MKNSISFHRLRALVTKEFIQILRDRSTFGLIFMMPIMQLLLYGYAINTNPRMLPTALVAADQSLYTRDITVALQNTQYFKITDQPATEAEAETLMDKGLVQFIIYIPRDFTRDLLRGDNPKILIAADATDPQATGNALASIGVVNQTALQRDFSNLPDSLQTKAPPYQIRVHQRYNPEGLTSYNIVPGLIGMLLNMTLISMTAVAMTRERERGTLENLLAMPAKPIEVMLGKIAPFVVIAYLQALLILVIARLLLGMPIEGNPLLLIAGLTVYIVANLGIGFSISTFATNQLQAMQLTFFYFMPSLLLSGFLFPFRGMPIWAQMLGSVFPMTHAMRILRGVVLKGIGLNAVWTDIWPMLIFIVFIGFVSMKRYRETID